MVKDLAHVECDETSLVISLEYDHTSHSTAKFIYQSTFGSESFQCHQFAGFDLGEYPIDPPHPIGQSGTIRSTCVAFIADFYCTDGISSSGDQYITVCIPSDQSLCDASDCNV